MAALRTPFVALVFAAFAHAASAETPPTQTPSAPPPAEASPAPVQGYEVARAYPHDPEAFTQGLFWRDGHLFESTGHYGRSTVRKVRLEDGAVLQSQTLSADYFGEGITDWEDRLISLTWRNGGGFVWDLPTLTPTAIFTYEGEGWGLTHDATRLIMSDGTADLRFLDPDTLVETGRITVTDGGRPVDRLNELEWIEGEIYANIWQSDRIARIDPATGRVKGWIDLAGLLSDAERASVEDDVLNGIAWDPAARRLFVTGKHWPRLFEIRLTEPRTRH